MAALIPLGGGRYYDPETAEITSAQAAPAAPAAPAQAAYIPPAPTPAYTPPAIPGGSGWSLNGAFDASTGAPAVQPDYVAQMTGLYNKYFPGAKLNEDDGWLAQLRNGESLASVEDMVRNFAAAHSSAPVPSPTPSSGWAPGQTTTASGNAYEDKTPAYVAPPVAPTNFTPYTLGGALDPAITKYLQDSVAYNTANGSGYGGAGGSFDVGNGNYVLPVVQPNVSESGTGPNEGQQYTGIAAHSSAPYTDGKLGYAYDPSGNLVTQFSDEPYKRDALEYGAMAVIAAASGGALGAAMGAGGAAGGGLAEAGSGTFLGEGAASGIGAWDAALANAPAWTAGDGMVANGAGSNLFPGEAPYTPTPGSTPLNFTPSPSVPSDLFPQEAPWTPTPNAQPLDFTPAAGAAGGAAGAGGGGGATSGAFHPAVDSQLANTQLGITGSQAAADAAAAGIPSVTVNGAPTGSWLSNLTASGGLVPGTGDVGGGVLGGLTGSKLLGAGSTLLGALGGSQAGAGSGSGGAGGTLDPRLAPYLYDSPNGLLPQTQATLNAQQPIAQQQSAQLASVGGGLLGKPIAGNGYGTVGTNVAANGYGTVGGPVAGNGAGQVQMADVGSFMNPFYGRMADDIGKRTSDFLGQNNAAIAGNSVATGGLGGSRQGVAQALAASKAADSLQGQLAGLGGSMYNTALSGALNKYGIDTNFYTAQRGQDLQGSAQAQNFYGQQRNSDIAKAGQDQSFYSANRTQDLAGAQLGGGLLSQSQTQAFAPTTAASSIYKPYTGLASSAGNSGTNWQGLLGGALQGASFGRTMGWW